jgi:hypothetical protein
MSGHAGGRRKRRRRRRLIDKTETSGKINSLSSCAGRRRLIDKTEIRRRTRPIPLPSGHL